MGPFTRDQDGDASPMNQEQLEQVRNGNGFIAALDQSGGSTPKASHVSSTTARGCPQMAGMRALGMNSRG